MTVAVTGATGFVGRHLLSELAGRGIRTIGTGYGESPESGTPSLDLRDPRQAHEFVARVRPDAVIHLAAQSSVGASFAAPRETFEVNVLGTLNLLDAIREEAPAARVLVVASADLYGPSAEGMAHRETSPYRPVSPYGASKAAQDLVSALAGAAYGLSVLRLRAFPQAGPGQRPTFALPSFAAQIAAAERGEAEPILQVGNLEVVRDYTDVRDVVRAYADLLTHGEPGEAYNVCSGRGLLLRHLVERLASAARVPIRIEEDRTRFRPADLPHLVGDPAKLEKATGFRPRVEIGQTLADLLEEARTRPAPAPAASQEH